MKNIYLDNSATTPLRPEVIEAMKKAMPVFGNPSSVYSIGGEAKSLVDKARQTVAGFLNCNTTEIIFTSGGSESDNLAIRGLINRVISTKVEKSNSPKISRQARDDNTRLHVITSMIEHHAVLHTVQDLEKSGIIEATYLKPDKDGVISAESVEKAIKPNTVLVSIMYVNNETGVINPIEQIGEMLRKNTEYRIQNTAKEKLNSESLILNSGKIYFHTDAVQAAGYLEMDVEKLGVDLLSIAGHKIHGPKGIGVLYVKKGTPLQSQITGGGQEFNLRAGTENVVSIAGLAAAIKTVQSSKLKAKSIAGLRDKLEDFILKNIAETRLNGAKDKRIPSVANISFKNAEGEAIILNLDFLGISVSSGSACTSRSLEPSYVLVAMDVPIEYTHGSIRFSLSDETTEADIDKVIEVLPGIIEKLRAMSPLRISNS